MSDDEKLWIARARQGNDDLLVRLAWNLLKQGDAADGQEDDAARPRPEAQSSHAVAELVGQNTGAKDAGQQNGEEPRRS